MRFFPDREASASHQDSGGPLPRWSANEATPHYRLYRLLALPLMKLYFRVTAEGRRNIPVTGPFILAANHLSYLDPLALAVTCTRPIHFMMLRGYWEKPLIGWASRKAGSFPVDQQGHAAAPLRQALAVLQRGSVLGIFPEGARSLDGRLLPGKAGVSLLVLKSGVPLVPAAIIGTHKALPKGRCYPLPCRVTVRYGPPMRFTPPASRDLRAFLHRTTAQIMEAIGDLLRTQASS